MPVEVDPKIKYKYKLIYDFSEVFFEWLKCKNHCIQYLHLKMKRLVNLI